MFQADGLNVKARKLVFRAPSKTFYLNNLWRGSDKNVTTYFPFIFIDYLDVAKTQN
jgi:hypothetical protein